MLIIKNITITVLATFVFLTSAQVSAATPLLNAEKKSTVVDQYKKKMAYYLKQDQLNSSPKVTYNLGVISYQLKQYKQAKTYFLKLLSYNDYHFLAKYNLGLVAYKLGDTQSAIKWFKRISAHPHKFKTSEKIIKLAKAQLAKLNQISPAHQKKLSTPKTKGITEFEKYAFVYYGHADNLSDPDGVVAEVEDNFLNIFAEMSWNLDELLAKGMSWKFDLYLKDYFNLNEYDYKIISTDFGRLFKVKNWRHSLRLKLEQSTYGADDYQSVARAEFKTEYRKSHYRLSARYRYDDITSDLIAYNAYAGNRQNLLLKYKWTVDAHKFQLGLDFETNDRADVLNATAIDRSYSPTRKKLELAWYYKINKKWKTRLKFDYRDSLYNDFSVLDGVVREGTRSRSNVQLKYRLQRNWWLVADYQLSDNDSNIARYGYTRHTTRVGVSGSF